MNWQSISSSQLQRVEEIHCCKHWINNHNPTSIFKEHVPPDIFGNQRNRVFLQQICSGDILTGTKFGYGIKSSLRTLSKAAVPGETVVKRLTSQCPDLIVSRSSPPADSQPIHVKVFCSSRSPSWICYTFFFYCSTKWKANKAIGQQYVWYDDFGL